MNFFFKYVNQKYALFEFVWVFLFFVVRWCRCFNLYIDIRIQFELLLSKLNTHLKGRGGIEMRKIMFGSGALVSRSK